MRKIDRAKSWRIRQDRPRNSVLAGREFAVKRGCRNANAHMPGSYILDEMAAREWTVQRLTTEMGLPKWRVEYVKRVICGADLEPEFAAQLSNAFGTSVTLWLNLEKAYRADIKAAK
jgi:plasmid maintenance system antidote protein VapI